MSLAIWIVSLWHAYRVKAWAQREKLWEEEMFHIKNGRAYDTGRPQ